MRIAICESNQIDREQLCRWTTQYCALYGIGPELCAYGDVASLMSAMRLRRFEIIMLSADGPEGFMQVRALREADASARLIFLTDTSRCAVMGIRLHLTDYIVKPVRFQQLVRALRLSGVDNGGRPWVD